MDHSFDYFRDFTWSPSDNLIAYWVPEDKDTPARLVMMEIPSRKERRSKNLFNVASVWLFTEFHLLLCL